MLLRSHRLLKTIQDSAFLRLTATPTNYSPIIIITGLIWKHRAFCTTNPLCRFQSLSWCIRQRKLMVWLICLHNSGTSCLSDSWRMLMIFTASISFNNMPDIRHMGSSLMSRDPMMYALCVMVSRMIRSRSIVKFVQPSEDEDSRKTSVDVGLYSFIRSNNLLLFFVGLTEQSNKTRSLHNEPSRSNKILQQGGQTISMILIYYLWSVCRVMVCTCSAVPGFKTIRCMLTKFDNIKTAILGKNIRAYAPEPARGRWAIVYRL